MSDADVATPTMPETRSFQADVGRLLDLMVHSVYSERDIFLRELVSNAADACEKLRYEAIAHPELVGDGEPFAITRLTRQGGQTPDRGGQRRSA